MTETHIDRQRLAQFREMREPGEPDPAIELIELFLLQGQELIVRTQTALAQGDHRAAREAVHSLKGSAGNVGADRLAALAAELENELAASQPKVGQASLDDMRGEFSHVSTLLEHEKSSS